MNHRTLETVMKVSHEIREEIDVAAGLVIDKGVPQFEEGSIEIIRQKIVLLFEKLEQIQREQEIPEVRTEVAEKTEVIMTSTRKTGLAYLEEKLKRLSIGRKNVKTANPTAITKVSPTPYGEIYINYLDDKGKQAFPIPLRISLSEKDTDWEAYWGILLVALKTKYDYFCIAQRKNK